MKKTVNTTYVDKKDIELYLENMESKGWTCTSQHPIEKIIVKRTGTNFVFESEV